MAAVASLKAHGQHGAGFGVLPRVVQPEAAQPSLPLSGGLLMQPGTGVCAPAHAASGFGGMEQRQKERGAELAIVAVEGRKSEREEDDAKGKKA